MGSQKGSHKGCLNLFYLSNESLEDARHLFPQCNCLIRLFGESGKGGVAKERDG